MKTKFLKLGLMVATISVFASAAAVDNDIVYAWSGDFNKDGVVNEADNNLFKSLLRTASFTSDSKITILTHGLGDSYGAWLSSESYVDANGNRASYTVDDRNTLAMQLSDEIYVCYDLDSNNTGNISVADAMARRVKKYVRQQFSDQMCAINNIPQGSCYWTQVGFSSLTNDSTIVANWDKPIVILYDGFNDTKASYTNECVSEHFAKTVNPFIYSYYLNFGVMPKIDLVSHSRGGLTNMIYTMNYPQLVNNMISVATPYGGTRYGKLLSVLIDDNTHMDDMMNTAAYPAQWRAIQAQYPSIRTYAIGAYETADAFEDNLQYMVDNEFDLLLDYVSAGLNDFWRDTFRNILSGFVNFTSNFGGSVDLFERFVNTTKNTIKALRATEVALKALSWKAAKKAEHQKKIDQYDALIDVFDQDFIFNTSKYGYSEVVLTDMCVQLCSQLGLTNEYGYSYGFNTEIIRINDFYGQVINNGCRKNSGSNPTVIHACEINNPIIIAKIRARLGR